jgi:Family of unknown function (DUF5996)
LRIEASDGATEHMALRPMSVADFHAEVMAGLARLGIQAHIWTMPSEIENAIPFELDRTHAQYDAAMVERFWQALVQADRLLKLFRARFIGKVSPVHFFWGSFDLAMTRFSGRRAPEHPGGVPYLADWVTREAYSHEVASFGFWPGTAGGYQRPAFYAYAYPQPDGFAGAGAQPEAAFYSETLREYLLPYDAIRGDADSTAAVQAFVRSTYDAAASRGGWDRASLERGKH